MATAAQLTQPKRAAVRDRRRAKFLELLRDGHPVTQAAEGAKIPRRTVYRWRHDDPDFAREWDEAWEQGSDLWEEELQRRALDGGSDLLLIFGLKGRRPQRYRDNVKHESDVRVTIDVTDARAELAKRFGMIEDHRARAVEGKARELPSPRTDVA
jgi:hypothetical protein